MSNTATVASGNDGGGSSTASVTINCAAIRILKQSTKLVNGVHPLVTNPGALFSVTGTASFTVRDNNNPGGAGTKSDESATAGEVCVSGLTPGNYTVNETTPPSGYGGASQTNVVAVAATGTDCGANKPSAANSAVFTNVPLGEITAGYHDLGSGETSATSITCAPSGGSNLTAQPEASDDDIPNNGGGSYNQDSTFNVTAGSTYVCTLVVDP
ncbi:MAG: hypothetical protein E6G20_11670 [Actinobacteria bacterium]|nr:MAG: hypothetical protein E6G20_11670 [Actinomycetota bacterium]